MARVELEKVAKVYPGGVKAVDAIDLDIADQEFVVLVGPSGCGKTTTLRMVAGLEEISGGVIRIGDRVVNDVPPKDRDIAMVFQNYALYPHMTVYKNMAFGLKLREDAQGADPPAGDARPPGSWTSSTCWTASPRPCPAGSGSGWRWGGRSSASRRRFCSTSRCRNLDAKLRVTTRAELKRLHQRLKTTTIYVTHDQEEAMTLGDRIVVMKDGVIQQADTPLVTYNHPANRFVAGFIGMPPMNFFDGAIKVVDGELVFEEGKLENAGAERPARRLGSGTAGAADEPVVLVGELTLPGNGFTLAVPARCGDGLRAGRTARGARHSAGAFPPAAGRTRRSESSPLEVKVNVIEPLGNDMDVYMETNLNDHVVGRVEAPARRPAR